MFSSCLGGKSKPEKKDAPTETAKPDTQKLSQAPVTSQKPSSKKYLVLVRHGERIDETFPEMTEDRGDEYWDTGITERGKKHSQETGFSIIKLLDELRVLDNMVEITQHEGKT